uniref:hypothetical protein n=1 Tax=Ornithobacterium rhinotracheale TaxID=28251 RepID=UPI0039A43202
MKKILNIIFISMILINCQKELYIKEIISNNEVAIIRNNNNEDSLYLIVPLDFDININRSDIRNVQPYFMKDNKMATSVGDFLVAIRENNKYKYLYGFRELDYKTYPKSITIISKNSISKNKGRELLEYYNSPKDIEKMNYGDTIFLVPYTQFRKDQPDFLSEMRKSPDSLFLILYKNKGNIQLREKINW